jgi:hypothetical protein
LDIKKYTKLFSFVITGKFFSSGKWGGNGEKTTALNQHLEAAK